MATPHIAGLIAVLISTFGNISPANMTRLLQKYALKGVVRNVRECYHRILWAETETMT